MKISVFFLSALCTHRNADCLLRTLGLAKHFLNNLSPFLSFFFQLSIDKSNIPVDWRQANVVTIFKKSG
jgi:hypothetical protein